MVDKTKVTVEVLRTFPYSEDGMTSRELVKGSVTEITADCLDGLAAEGYVRAQPSSVVPVDQPVTLPLAAPEAKAMPDVPENKALGETPENKTAASKRSKKK